MVNVSMHGHVNLTLVMEKSLVESVYNVKEIYDITHEFAKKCDCLIYEFMFSLGRRNIGEKLSI